MFPMFFFLMGHMGFTKFVWSRLPPFYLLNIVFVCQVLLPNGENAFAHMMELIDGIPASSPEANVEKLGLRDADIWKLVSNLSFICSTIYFVNKLTGWQNWNGASSDSFSWIHSRWYQRSECYALEHGPRRWWQGSPYCCPRLWFDPRLSQECWSRTRRGQKDAWYVWVRLLLCNIHNSPGILFRIEKVLVDMGIPVKTFELWNDARRSDPHAWRTMFIEFDRVDDMYREVHQTSSHEDDV